MKENKHYRSRSIANSTPTNKNNRSFVKAVGASMAQDNDVRSFNKPRQSDAVPPNLPQRIELPLFFNTPSRIKSDRQPILKKLDNTTLDRSIDEQQKVDSGVLVSAMRRLKDYQTLAFACRRGGKVRDEGRAYYSMGVLYDNIKKYKKGIDCYQKFLEVCKGIGDSHGEALAYNCIGVDYQILGQKDSAAMQKAIQYHSFHQQLADTNGKFLASINLGLCYDGLGDSKNSTYWYQCALKHSVKMSNLTGQSLALGNIGKIGAKGLNQNKDKMKLFVDKYLKLAKELNDSEGEMKGRLKLGLISGSKRNFDQGRDNFRRALELAQSTGKKQYKIVTSITFLYLLLRRQIYNQAKCGFAVLSAQKNMPGYIRTFTNNLDNTAFLNQ